MPNVKIYNTLSKKKETIKPLKNKTIHFFVCGPTVYDYSHIGHARTYIIFDCFVKYLRSIGYKVYYLQNITDIDDKIIMRAKERGVSPKDLAEVFIREHLKDMKSIGVDSVTKYAKATAYIKEIISQIKRLQAKGFVYELEDGIYFDISKFKNYGKLSRRTALQAEDSISRIDYSKNKKNRGDFCLWKFSVEGEPSWPSPFGKGRPGWHIEDTAITEKFFGSQYDIHGGAIDLIFPHHEAEISQMEAISGKPLSKYWMHTGFLTIGDQKMSKSMDNFITIEGFLKRHSYQHIRFWVARNLWRSPLNYSESAMIEAKTSLEKIEEFLRKVKAASEKTTKIPAIQRNKAHHLLQQLKKDFYLHLSDDFNTPKAFASLFDFIKRVNVLLEKEFVDKKTAKEIISFFQEVNAIFDFIDFKRVEKSKAPKEVEELLKEREKYRKLQNWQMADQLRMKIEKYGFTVEDTKEGAILKR